MSRPRAQPTAARRHPTGHPAGDACPLDPNKRTPCLPQAPPPSRSETTCGPLQALGHTEHADGPGQGACWETQLPPACRARSGWRGDWVGRGTRGRVWETQAAGAKALWLGACWGGAAGGHVARRRSSGAGGHLARRRSSGPQEGPGRGREHVPGERRAWGSFPSQSPHPPLEPHAAHPGQHPGPRPTGVGGPVAVRALLPCSPSSGCMRPPGAPARRRPESRPTPLPLRDPSPHLSACPEPSPGAALGQPPTEAPSKA